MESRALGKGLSALIPEKTVVDRPESVAYIKTSEIKENTFQPRTKFNDSKLSDLVASIKEKGVLQPILVRKKEKGYEVIAGERRLRAARALAMDEVPVVIKSVDDKEALVLALVENIQREELNAIEEAHAYQRLVDEFNFTQDIVAQSVGKDRSTISNSLRLLKLPLEIQRAVSDETLTMGHARALLGVDDAHAQKKLFDHTSKKGLSVRELENLIKSEANKSGKKRKGPLSSHKDVYLASVEDDLQKTLGTKVRIVAQKKRGKIVIEYYSNADLERIMGIIKK